MPKIVLVDDEIWALRGLESLLQEYPEYTVAATFTNGQEALAYLRTHPCDVVFTDLHMDQMGGQQLIAACTQERIPVRMVIISAYSDFSAAREGLRSGGEGRCGRSGAKKDEQFLHISFFRCVSRFIPNPASGP